MKRTGLHLLMICVIATACSDNKKLFEIHNGSDLGIGFQNTITANDSLNALTFEYIYNGSGVGAADFNNDGLTDLFFGGNQVSSKLYINNGNLKFEDVTEKAGVSTTRWVAGVSVVDINRDGKPDIYLSVAGKTEGENRRNLLFINQGSKDGIPSFVESGKAYGLDDDSYSTMAAFLDYDKDGDLDMYLVNNWLEAFNRNNLRPKRVNGEAQSTDKLFRNNGDNTFTNVSRESGILIEGYGLGVNVCDLNNDSWPDIYVSNDFMSNDLIWINQKNGTFRNMAGDYLKHQTHNGMGVDIADYNNDELADIIVVDMLPPGHVRQKMMTPGQNYDHFHMSLGLGYQPQYMRNTLQLNRGPVKDGEPAFSEIAFMAGVAKTDWSWAPLFADLDNDGWKDLFIANGYRKDVTDLDFIFFGVESGSPFGTPDARRKVINKEFDKVSDVKITNYAFRNTGTLSFEDKTKDWGIELPTFSNGAAYADLDNDGDLDLITNNIDQDVIVYENHLERNEHKSHYLNLHCADTSSFNQKVWIYTSGKLQYQELTPYRGFQSTVSADLHFGLGEQLSVDSIIIEWPDQTVARYFNTKADTTIQFSHEQAVAALLDKTDIQDVGVHFTESKAINSSHRELSPSDIKITRTLLHELSRFGPCTATGDVNKDNLDDIFIGGERGSASHLFIQNSDGTFLPTILPIDSLHEDGAATFFDADSDGDNDLYVAGSCPSSQEAASMHHLFLNDGKGKFNLSTGIIPDITSSTSCVISSDYDGDGDHDLFIGGRIKPKEYPFAARSFVLRNDKGKFTDVTAQLNAGLESPGLISSALWADVDNDKKTDLILAGEWMPIRIFRNDGSVFKEVTDSYGLNKTGGWWNCVQAADVNGDGFVDIIAGNTGKNSYFQPTDAEPVRIVAKDIDKNGSTDPIVTYFNTEEKQRYVVHNRLVLIDQIPLVKKRFETFRQYATTPFEQMFTSDQLGEAYSADVYSLSSSVFVNNSGKGFTRSDLPEITQISVINDIVADDLNGDGNIDLILIGNNYSQETLFGRYDASLGSVLLGDGKLNWNIPSPGQTNLIVDGDAKFAKVVRTSKGKGLLIVNNDSKSLYYLIQNTGLK